DRERMMNQLSVSLPAIRKQLMLDILMGYAEDYAVVQPQLEYLGVALLPGNYTVLLLEPKPEVSETFAINRAMLRALMEMFEQHLARECAGFAVSLDNGLIAGVLSFEAEAPAANMQRALGIARTLVQAIRAELHATVVVGVGAFHGPFGEIKDSYAEALEALKYISFSDPLRAVLPYAEIKRVTLGTEYALSGHVDSIVRALRGCDEAAMLHAVGSLEEAIERAKLPFRTVHSLYRMIQLQAGTVVLESGIDPDPDFHAQTLAIRQTLEDARTLLALDQAIRKLLPYYLGLLKQKREEPSAGKSQVEAIREYLEAHFADPLLSQASIAQAFDLSPSYVSRLFRQSTGENYTEALASIRVERAKTLLSEPGANVNLVATQVGFVSAHTFIRTFKKLTGVTPGRWGKTSGESPKPDGDAAGDPFR
ncbi:MAG TPA: helix-turn-helix domain-containing protein, partial [Clostridia bacterium]|nr:helix-turn-helix domain-containing protein [Clostridia bacterium]